jgi:hypothetical protein
VSASATPRVSTTLAAAARTMSPTTSPIRGRASSLTPSPYDAHHPVRRIARMP